MKRNRCLVAPIFAAGLFLSAPAVASTLIVCTEGNPDTLSPQYTTSGTTYDVTENIYNKLVMVERGGAAIVPGLAETWTASPDAKVFEFKLRKGVKWQSNKTFTPTRDMNADDVIFTFERQGNRDHPFHKVGGAAYATYENVLAGKIAKLEKVDDYTVRFTLNVPTAAFVGSLSDGSFAIMSAEYADMMLKAGTPDQIDTAPVGTGPFSLVRFQRDTEVRMKKFPGYWGNATPDMAAKVDNVVYLIAPEPSVRIAKLKAGECHIARYPNMPDFETIKADPKLELVQGPVADMSYITFKLKEKPFSDKRVREALAHAIDLEAINKAVFFPGSKTTGSLVPPTLWGRNDELKPRAYDPEKAKALLAEAGYPEGFTTDLWAMPIARPYMPNGRRTAEMIQADWAKIGVKAKIVTYEWGEYIKRIRNREASVGMTGGMWDFPDPGHSITGRWTCVEGKPRPNNTPDWCNADFQKEMDAASQISDQEQRAKHYRNAQEIWLADIPGVLLGNGAKFEATRREVKDFKVQPFGGTPLYGVSLAD
ncbi:MAG: transporter substrate-binding protein [Microvirga sp.]|nr:transporter substrate-binding protein [Microvirga sp.]